MALQAPSDLEQRPAELIEHHLVLGDRLLRLAGELHMRARQMDEDGHRSLGDAPAAGMLQPVAPPVDALDHLGEQAATLLVHQRHAVGEPEHLDG